MRSARLIPVTFVIITVLALVAGCAQPTVAPTEAPAAPAATEPPAEPEKFRVAVVMPSAINDLAFSQSMYDALGAIQD